MSRALCRAATAVLDNAAAAWHTRCGAAAWNVSNELYSLSDGSRTMKDATLDAEAYKQYGPAATVADAKKKFTSSVAQITRGDPNCAFSVMPTIVDLILDSIPNAVNAVAITGIEEEALQKAASQEPFAANKKGMLPLMDVVFSVDAPQIFPVIKFLHSHAQLQFQILTDMTAVDYPERVNGRFEVTYLLASLVANARIIVKTSVDELTPLESITPIYKNAEWLERECWDMFGVFFSNHPDLRRLLTDYGFTHHPLRKDFPVQGYTEIYYSELRKGITTRSIQLAQTQRVVAGQSQPNARVWRTCVATMTFGEARIVQYRIRVKLACPACVHTWIRCSQSSFFFHCSCFIVRQACGSCACGVPSSS
eukprot:TRINITY_DN1171_c1_g1_i2.p1 TRINITY_DN1171_c1_g1~~TRINITY_DN1171_c1_g1_i2.p1  ORF type:complete len:366 (+),score=38.43 TRINITY_DN1171_c1_g1_i2:175-1272(+)